MRFFEKRGHKIIPSASLVPENDSSVLFNTAGMQPLVPYLLGEEHPEGRRLANIQKCVRTNDIDEVGDNTHLTFFEMLGNWSLGAPERSDGSVAPASDGTGYWKEESINWSYELLTSKDEGFGLDPQRLYVTCFEGDLNAPRDEESAEIWRKIFEKNVVIGERIYFRPKEKNWWPQPKEKDDYSGPCGPDTEMFYDLTGELNKGMTLAEYIKADDEQIVVEIWNNVFMQYLKKDGKVVGELDKKNVDTGAGFERIVTVVQGKKSVFDTDIFDYLLLPLKPKDLSNKKSGRIAVDHIRSAVFIINDGTVPSNTDRGYILRRLLRRAYVHIKKIGASLYDMISIANLVAGSSLYKKYSFNSDLTKKIIKDEMSKFEKTLDEGLKKFDKNEDPFVLFTTYGFPIELTMELAKEKGIEINRTDFDEKFRKHQEISRAGSEQKFKGGLSGTGEMETKYHTCAHLLHQALRDVFNPELLCKGSNITPERLRFDFPFDRKLTDEEKNRIEGIVNQKISEKIPVNKVVMKKEDALKTGALHVFDTRYPNEVNVYYIGNTIETAYSKEFCGGPHVENTGDLAIVRDPEEYSTRDKAGSNKKVFRIIKEEAVSANVRRIKAVLE